VLNKKSGELHMACGNLGLECLKPPADLLRVAGRQAKDSRIELLNQCLHHLFRIVMASVIQAAENNLHSVAEITLCLYQLAFFSISGVMKQYLRTFGVVSDLIWNEFW
jgi:hypothetical protein